MSGEIEGSGVEMKEIRLYLYSTIKGGRAGKGAYTYVLETDAENGPVTLSKTEAVEGMTAHKAELISFIAALKRICKKSRLVIYTDSYYLAVNTRDCLTSWEKNDWKTAKGTTVKHKEEWQEIYSLIQIHSFRFEITSGHSYYLWMKRESEAAECM